MERISAPRHTSEDIKTVQTIAQHITTALIDETTESRNTRFLSIEQQTTISIKSRSAAIE
ncbi:MAG: hypothetical protein JSS82_00215 [Bacteroidetes bacterium]|nr:hypothetical protein [Bacteroidota bacterium]